LASRPTRINPQSGFDTALGPIAPRHENNRRNQGVRPTMAEPGKRAKAPGTPVDRARRPTERQGPPEPNTPSRAKTMSQATLTDDIALRIGLAARTLPDTDPARMLKVLADAVGLPPTAESLAGLKVKDLKTAAEGELAEIDADALKKALALLKGEADMDIAPPPPVEPYADGEMPGSIRVACASNGGDQIDGHFGSARRFLVYQVSSESHRLIDCRDIDDSQAEDDKNSHRAGLIADCQVLYCASIGGPAAAKVVKRDIHPIKLPDGPNAGACMAELSRILGNKAPPWLAKVMGADADERVRFEREASEA